MSSTPRGGCSRAPAARERARSRLLRAPSSASATAASRRTLSELIERAIDASGYREHVLGLELGRATAGERAQAAAAGARASKRARAATCAASSTTSPACRRAAAAREPDAPVEGGRAGRGAPDEHPRGEGPGVSRRVRGRPRARTEPAPAGPARGRRAHRPALVRLDGAEVETGARLRAARRGAQAAPKPRRRTGSCTSR